MNWNSNADCSALLQTLLDQSHVAVAANDADKKIQAQKDLLDFIRRCSAPVQTDELDDIATRAIDDILEATLDAALAGLASRTAELASLTQSLQAVTATANNDAAAIRLDRAHLVMVATAQVVTALKNLQQSLNSGSPADQALNQAINDLLAAIQTVSNTVKTLNP